MLLGEQKRKKELLRIVNNKDEGVLLDISPGKKNGRGAYICIQIKCVDKLRKKNKIKYCIRIKWK